MTQTTTAWTQAKSRLTTLEHDLRHRFELVGEDASEERRTLEASVRGVIALFDDLRESATLAVRDRQLREDIAELGRALREALHATVDHDGKAGHHPPDKASRAAHEPAGHGAAHGSTHTTQRGAGAKKAPGGTRRTATTRHS